MYDYNFMQLKVGFNRGRVTPHPLVGVGLDTIMKNYTIYLKKKNCIIN